MMDAEAKREIIAARIKEARRMSGLSQLQVADILKIQRPTISEMEAGNRKVTAEEIAQLADLYDVSVNWLLGEGEEKLDIHDTKLQLAARELNKLKKDDLDRLLTLLASLRE
ncbi:MAG: helix-turn-helix transcriptional regulator [Tatlockia sp.]|jgi:transcriptional regulator with XRE-family HTH domain|nr:helix-turn-helix transcriptional regulator [Tatlockia sp.]